MGKRKDIILGDDEIVELYFSRSENAIKETDRKYSKYLLAIANNILGDERDCEECLNDTYLGAWNSIPPVRPKNLRTYLSKIMRNKAVDRYDEEHRQKRISAESCDPLEDFEFIIGDRNLDDEVEAKKIGNIINSYLDALPDRRHFIFMSRFYYAMPLAEIARKLGVSTSTVNKELAAMKNELRAKLTDGGIDL